MSTNSLPLLQHALESASAFTPERLMDAVRAERGLANEAVPALCVLDFDGDLSDRLWGRVQIAPYTLHIGLLRPERCEQRHPQST